MTAAIGHPTLRLMRVRIGSFWLGELEQGKRKTLSPEEYKEVLATDEHR
jgi:23S rRNA pseudouridine2457 synthase